MKYLIISSINLINEITILIHNILSESYIRITNEFLYYVVNIYLYDCV